MLTNTFCLHGYTSFRLAFAAHFVRHARFHPCKDEVHSHLFNWSHGFGATTSLCLHSLWESSLICLTLLILRQAQEERELSKNHYSLFTIHWQPQLLPTPYYLNLYPLRDHRLCDTFKTEDIGSGSQIHIQVILVTGFFDISVYL